MKCVKRFLIGAILVALLSSLCAVPALATDNFEVSTDVIYYEDGSYLTVEMVVYRDPLTRAAFSVSGSKTVIYRNSSAELLWDFTVHGTFICNGTTATATNASYSYNIYHDAWVLKSAKAYCSGDAVIATGTFNGGLLLNRSTTVSLTCSPDGTLS